MRKRRLKAPASWDRAFYHCISRVVDRRFAFGDEDHAEFIRFMRQYESNRHRKHRLEEYATFYQES